MLAAPDHTGEYWTNDASGYVHGTLTLAKDLDPPFIFVLLPDDGDVETLTRSELVTYGKRLDEIQWPASWTTAATLTDAVGANEHRHDDPPESEPQHDIQADFDSESVNLRVATWNCQGVHRNDHDVATLLSRCPRPDIVLLSETWTTGGTLTAEIRNICSANRYTPAFSSAPKHPTKRKGRNKGGVAVLVSNDWAHPSIVRPWKGPAVPGYLDGVDIETKGGGSFTILAAYVSPSPDDATLTSRVRETIVHAATRYRKPTIIGGDFNGALRGERDALPTHGDTLHRNMLRESGLRGYTTETRRDGTCFVGLTTRGSRIDDLLVNVNIHPPTAEEVLPKKVFPTQSVHTPLISSLQSPTPSKRGDIGQTPPRRMLNKNETCLTPTDSQPPPTVR
jgi:exonuclease III